MTQTMLVKLLSTEAVVPAYQSEDAAGLDLVANNDADLTLQPFQYLTVPTGIAIQLPKGSEGQVRPRSGLAAKHGITVLNAPGTIDADYTGQVSVILINLSDKPYTIRKGDRIAQLVVAPVIQVQVAKAEVLYDTVRGDAGFGSTGTR